MAGLPPNPPLPGLHGASVVITGRRKDVLDGAVAALRGEGIAAAGLQGDVRQAAACADWVANTLAMYGGLDILVNCAAGNFLANAAELSQGGFKTGARPGGPAWDPARWLARRLLGRLLVPGLSYGQGCCRGRAPSGHSVLLGHGSRPCTPHQTRR
jgi:hypothetical protein